MACAPGAQGGGGGIAGSARGDALGNHVQMLAWMLVEFEMPADASCLCDQLQHQRALLSQPDVTYRDYQSTTGRVAFFCAFSTNSAASKACS